MPASRVDISGAFKDAFQTTRCLTPADGFYEWTKSPVDDGRDPWHIHLLEHQPFSFAGLWAHNKKLGITSCTISSRRAPPAPAIVKFSRFQAMADPTSS
jgi:putative SOS response-associated peptidase YedK